jgi:PKD repeat protein
LSNTYDGVLYAIENGADVINMSYGSNHYSNTSQNLFNWANQNGIVLIASAGNDGSSSPQYPAAYNHVISVAATNGNDAKASFSNYDNGSGWVDLAAPGTSIYSTLPTGSGSYGYKQGTSMSGPIVAGLVGLMLSQNPGLTPSDVETCLKNNCDQVSGSYASLLGAGRINASDVMSCVSSTLSWAPQADFEASVTTIAAGGTVNFTDLSIYNPTSWSWNFGGGTPSNSSQQNPSGVVFSTPGTYTVSMTASNSNGNDMETKTSYITVNASTGCDTATNTLPGDTIYTRMWDTGNNYLGGTNNKGITVYCEYFQDIYPAGTYIQDLVMFFTTGETNTTGSSLDITIWEDNNGEPGNVLHSETLSMQEIEDNQTVPGNPNSFYPTVVNLSTPLLIQGDFYVGIEVSGSDPSGEEAAIAYTHNFNYDNSGRSGSSWLYISSSNPWSVAPGWKNIETFLNGSPKYAMHVYARTTSLPVLSQISASSQSVCQGDLVSFDGSASTNGSTYEWYVNGASSSYSNAVAPDFTFNTSGTHTSYLVTYNTCGFYNVDSIDIVVNASPNVTLSASDLTLCTGETSSLTASGASTYVWSPASSLSASTGSSVTASPGASTTYTVVGTSGQCTGVANVSIVIEGTPVSDFKYVPDTNLCFNQSIYFDGAILSSNGTSYSWDFGNASPSASTSATQSVVFPSAGTYSVSLSVENGCNESDLITQNVIIEDCDYAGIFVPDDPWGIIKYLGHNNQLFVKVNSYYNTELELFNLLGELIYRTSLNGGLEYFVDLSAVPNGVYSYRLFSKRASISSKFIKY